ncbi:MAG: hypothetical protein Q4C61_05540, partial [Lachnospiraceae bacterium]|nr:hypothetical protein [Lachnospiraceae bacterium]
MSGNRKKRLIGGTAMAAVLAVNAVSSAAATYEIDPAFGMESVEYIDEDIYNAEPVENEAVGWDNDFVYDEEIILQDVWENEAGPDEVPGIVPVQTEPDEVTGIVPIQTETDGNPEEADCEIQILDVTTVGDDEEGMPIPEEVPGTLDISEQMRKDWESAAASVVLTGYWAEDTAAIARVQVGYTPYGYGEDSTDFRWDTLLAEFCLDYAGVFWPDLPRPEEEQDWAELLAEKGLYEQEEKENIPVGALVFLDLDEDGRADRTGIVTKTEAGRLTAVCGNMEGAVGEYTVPTKDTALLGFCPVPENPAVPPVSVEPETSLEEETNEAGTEEGESETFLQEESTEETETETSADEETEL